MGKGLNLLQILEYLGVVHIGTQFIYFTQVKGLSCQYFAEKVCVLITPVNHARFYLRAPFLSHQNSNLFTSGVT